MVIWQLTVYAYEPGFDYPPVTHIFSGETQEAVCDTYNRHLACDAMLAQRTCEGLTCEQWETYDCAPPAEPMCPPEERPVPVPPPLGVPPHIPTPPEHTPAPTPTPTPVTPSVPPRFTPTTPVPPPERPGNGWFLQRPPRYTVIPQVPGFRDTEIPRNAPMDPGLAAQLAPWLRQRRFR